MSQSNLEDELETKFGLVDELLKINAKKQTKKDGKPTPPSKNAIKLSNLMIMYQTQAETLMVEKAKLIVAGKSELPAVMTDGTISEMFTQVQLYSQIATHRYYEAKVAECLLIAQAWIVREGLFKDCKTKDERDKADASLDENLRKIGYSLSVLKKRHAMLSFFSEYPGFLYTQTSINDIQVKKSDIVAALNSNEEWKTFFSRDLDNDYLKLKEKWGDVSITTNEEKENVEKHQKRRKSIMQRLRRAA